MPARHPDLTERILRSISNLIREEIHMFGEIVNTVVTILILWVLPAVLLILNLNKAGMRKWWYLFLALPGYIWIATIVALVKASKLKKHALQRSVKKLVRARKNPSYLAAKKPLWLNAPTARLWYLRKEMKYAPNVKANYLRLSAISA